MAQIDFTEGLHKKTSRNYLERVVDHDKAACAERAIQYGEDYWDGDRRYGYGGFKYDGRWRPVAERITEHYGLTSQSRILDVGCGKGYLLFEFTQILPGVEVAGVDLSQYAIDHAKGEIKPFIKQADATELPWGDNSFDLVYSLMTLHNLYNWQLDKALKEMERVSRGDKYFTAESYRNEQEKVNLLYWQLTCRAFHTPEEWAWLCRQAGYTGDFGFLFFE